MNYIISAATDVGIKKNTNQDSLTVKKINAYGKKMAFALLCDGMGGLSKGEVASTQLVRVFDNWVMEELPLMMQTGIVEQRIREQWNHIVQTQNNIIMNYGKSQGVSLGTTVVAILITDERYYIMNVGDSRAYQITNYVKQLTKDQTVVAREVEMEMITQEQAEIDPRRSVLLQCVGASDVVNPEFIFGDTRKDATYMLCSDGFRHEISQGEILEYLEPDKVTDENIMKNNMEHLINLNKLRMEQDNISVISIRTY